MASIDDLLGSIETLKGAIDQSKSAANATRGVADETYSQFQALGAEGVAAILNTAKDQIEATFSALDQAMNEAEQARSTAESAKG